MPPHPSRRPSSTTAETEPPESTQDDRGLPSTVDPTLDEQASSETAVVVEKPLFSTNASPSRQTHRTPHVLYWPFVVAWGVATVSACMFTYGALNEDGVSHAFLPLFMVALSMLFAACASAAASLIPWAKWTDDEAETVRAIAARDDDRTLTDEPDESLLTAEEDTQPEGLKAKKSQARKGRAQQRLADERALALWASARAERRKNAQQKKTLANSLTMMSGIALATGIGLVLLIDLRLEARNQPDPGHSATSPPAVVELTPATLFSGD